MATPTTSETCSKLSRFTVTACQFCLTKQLVLIAYESVLHLKELDRKVSNILDKLTPQTFQRQESQILELEIDSPERLKGVADRIFEKVSYCWLFSFFCSVLFCFVGLFSSLLYSAMPFVESPRCN